MENQNPSYLQTTLTNAVIVGAVITIISIVGLYLSISGEPTGAMFQASSAVGIVACLVSALAGILSVKSYAKMEGVSLTLGNGAVIGLVAGLFTAVVSSLISEFWNGFIDPSLMENFADYTVKNMEIMFNNMGMSADQIDPVLGEMEKGFEEQKTLVGKLKTYGMAGLGYGIINVISGLITAKMVTKD